MTGFDISLDGETYSVSMEYSEDENDYLYTLDGESLDFDDVLDQIEALTNEGDASDASLSLGELISFTFRAEGWDDVELVIYSYDSSTCVAVINGEVLRFTSRTDAEEVCDAVSALLTAEAE